MTLGHRNTSFHLDSAVGPTMEGCVKVFSSADLRDHGNFARRHPTPEVLHEVITAALKASGHVSPDQMEESAQCMVETLTECFTQAEQETVIRAFEQVTTREDLDAAIQVAVRSDITPLFHGGREEADRAIAMTANAIDVGSTPPTQQELATWIRQLECPPETLVEAGQRLEAMWDESPGPLRITGWVLGGLHGWFDAEPTPGEFHAAAEVCVDVAAQRKKPNPLAPLVRAWLDSRKTSVSPHQASILTAGNCMLTRIPTPLTTSALATWKSVLPGEDAVVDAIIVDGEPMATMHICGRRPLKSHFSRPSRATGLQGELLTLPGTRDAESLILQRAAELDHIGVDRRNPLHADVFFMLALSCGLTHPVTVDVATVGAWLTGRFSTNGIKTSERQDLERRAWDALSWARQWIILPSGHRYALLDVGTTGFPEGVVQLVPIRLGRGQGG